MVIKLSLKGIADVRQEGRNYFAACPAASLRKALARLIADFDCDFINSISGVDAGASIDVVYHVTVKGAVVSLTVTLPKLKPEVESVSDLFPGAALFERELMEMLGVKVLNHPTGGRLFLPDSFPNVHPLRKDGA